MELAILLVRLEQVLITRFRSKRHSLLFKDSFPNKKAQNLPSILIYSLKKNTIYSFLSIITVNYAADALGKTGYWENRSI